MNLFHFYNRIGGVASDGLNFDAFSSDEPVAGRRCFMRPIVPPETGGGSGRRDRFVSWMPGPGEFVRSWAPHVGRTGPFKPQIEPIVARAFEESRRSGGVATAVLSGEESGTFRALAGDGLFLIGAGEDSGSRIVVQRDGDLTWKERDDGFCLLRDGDRIAIAGREPFEFRGGPKGGEALGPWDGRVVGTISKEMMARFADYACDAQGRVFSLGETRVKMFSRAGAIRIDNLSDDRPVTVLIPKVVGNRVSYSVENVFFGHSVWLNGDAIVDFGDGRSVFWSRTRMQEAIRHWHEEDILRKTEERRRHAEEERARRSGAGTSSGSSRTQGSAGPASSARTDSSWEYTTLGVTRAVRFKDLKKAFHKRAVETHPDTHSGDPQAGEKFKRVCAAYEAICREHGWNL